MRVILSCAGTGGHIYPAIAIADKIKERHPEAEILFIGTKTGMENRLVPAAGYDIKGIDSKGFDRKNLLKNFETLSALNRGSREAARIIKEFAPDAVIGTGGYVTVPVIESAHRHGFRTYIHEQNAFPGVANKLLSRVADKVFVSFKGTEKVFRHPDRAVLTGNPVRSDFMSLGREECRRKLGIAEGETMILVFGGSLGAEMINRAALEFVGVNELSGIRLFVVTGKRYYEDMVSELAKKKNADYVTLLAYADNMPELMCASDLIASRSGAIAVAEITACGKPSVLVPSPNVTNNHQYYNAKAVADEGAAVLLEEKYLKENPSALAEELLSLLARPESMASMAEAARKAGTLDAAERIAEETGF